MLIYIFVFPILQIVVIVYNCVIIIQLLTFESNQLHYKFSTYRNVESNVCIKLKHFCLNDLVVVLSHPNTARDRHSEASIEPHYVVKMHHSTQSIMNIWFP